MKLEFLGYTEKLATHRIDHNLSSLEVGRVILEHKERYTIRGIDKEYQGELIGNLRFTAKDRRDFPAVGDWVAFAEYDEDKALIHAIYPRHSSIERKAVGRSAEIQIIATNIDYGLIVQAVDRDFNLNRLERYLTICNSSHVRPIIVLSKIDLIDPDELTIILNKVSQRVENVPVVCVSNLTEGYHQLESIIEAGKTYCLLGSSGVGKSTLLNSLSGKQQMKTGAISTSVKKGRHITSHRELILLENGGILIDNPGMREVGIADSSEGLELTFESIIDYAQNCKFKNCSHSHEDGCGILAALESGQIDKDAYNNFRKMEKEKEHFDSSALERRRKDKSFGKMIKAIQKEHKKTKF